MSTDALIDELWPDEPPDSARNSVQRFVSDIRTGLGDERGRVVASRAGYMVEAKDNEVDTAQIERAIRAASANADDPVKSLRALRESIDQLGERLCAGSDDLRSVRTESERLDRLRVRAMEHAGSLAEDHGIDIAEDLEDWLRDQPFNERIAGLLMGALARSGRQHDALAIYREIRSRLQREVGVSPGPELDRIEQDVLAQKVDSQLVRRAPLSPVAARAQLIGRDPLLASVEGVLESSRLVTLTGMGGVGKTAIAMRMVSRRGLGKSHVARLADTTTKDAIVESIAQCLGLESSSSERPTDIVIENITRYIAANDVLLVIDNAEHLIEEVASVVARLLDAPGSGRVLVTSRERLAISGESVLPVEPLELPVKGSDLALSPAIQLFAMRGAETGAFTAAELLEHEATERTCRMLDGLPLAIELAAVQLSVFGPSELADRLEVSLDALGRRRAAGRKGSLSDVLAWSWELLTSDEQSLLAELAAYSGWTAETVEFLEPELGVDLLQALVDKSLVIVERSATGPPRFSMLETVRQFAYQKLTSSDARSHAHRRHAAWMIDLATRPTLVESLMVAEAMAPLTPERSNLSRAFAWLKANDQYADYIKLLTFAAGSVAHHGSAVEASDHYAHAVTIARELRLDRGDRPGAPWLDDDAFGALLVAACDVGNAVADVEWALSVGFEAAGLVDGHPFDWAPGVLGTVATIVESVLLDHAAMSLLDDAEGLAARTPSATLNQAQVACWRGMTELMNRRYDSSLRSFQSALQGNPPSGRNLLLAESGAALSLLALNRLDEACVFVETMRSQPDTDNWHYMVDIVSSVVLGSVDPAAGLNRLEASLGMSADCEVGGYVADVRVAAGVLAHYVGDIELSREMLNGSFGRSPMTLLLLVEYSDGSPWRDLSPEEWTTRWQTTVLELFVTDGEPTDTWVAKRPKGRPVRKALSELRQTSRQTSARRPAHDPSV